MKIFCLTLILILTVCAVSFAQTNENPKCPAISVDGPWESVKFGETARFTAKVGKDAEKFSITYYWTLSTGKILEGEGTATILIVETEAGKSPTATVEIGGLPKNCENSSSETLALYHPPRIEELIEFSISHNQINKAALKELRKRLEDNPIAQIYIIERFVKKTSSQTIKRKQQKTIDYLNSIGMDVSRFTFINGYADKNRTQFILVPAGAELPTCDDCKEIELK